MLVAMRSTAHSPLDFVQTGGGDAAVWCNVLVGLDVALTCSCCSQTRIFTLLYTEV